MVAVFLLFALATLLMLLRITVKIMGQGGGWGMDDWLIMPAYVSFLTSGVPDTTMGQAVHSVSVTLELTG